MAIRKVILLSVLALLSMCSTEPTPTPKEETSAEVSLLSEPFYNRAVILTAAVLTSIGLVALTAFFFPVMAYRVCYALGGCQNTMDSYVDELIGKQLGKARNVRSRNKRSLEYIEPILVTLAKAYEQYGDQDVTKNLMTRSYYTK